MLLQRVDQPVVVPLMQPDARLVQDVQHAHQAGADLGRQPDPLRLAAGQGARRPVKGEVVQAHVDQEAEPVFDLLQHLPGDGCSFSVSSRSVEKGRALPASTAG